MPFPGISAKNLNCAMPLKLLFDKPLALLYSLNKKEKWQRNLTPIQNFIYTHTLVSIKTFIVRDIL